MAISAHFKHKGFTPEKYDETISRLNAAGNGTPPGRLEHVAIEANGEIEVFDIWESQEALEAWGPQGVRADPARARRRAPPAHHPPGPKHHPRLTTPTQCVGAEPAGPSEPTQRVNRTDIDSRPSRHPTTTDM